MAGAPVGRVAQGLGEGWRVSTAPPTPAPAPSAPAPAASASTVPAVSTASTVPTWWP